MAGNGVASIGECMLELSRPAADWKLAYGGDALNTAIHLARAGHDVAFSLPSARIP